MDETCSNTDAADIMKSYENTILDETYLCCQKAKKMQAWEGYPGISESGYMP